jgi:cysteinyl-tRNA synthetase
MKIKNKFTAHRWAVFSVLIIASIVQLLVIKPVHPDTISSPGLDPPLPLSEISCWAYQLQGITEPHAVDRLVESQYDLLVLEPTRTDWSSDDREFDTHAMVERLKSTPASDGDHRKLVLAYVDIGEAEDWRWYWTWSAKWDSGDPMPDDWPDFILARDPDGWEGDYPVAYWNPDWQDIVIYGENQDSSPYGDYTSAMDEIISDGFDGVYLDWVEGYENPDVIRAARSDNVDPKTEMVEFIRKIRDYAISRNPDFLIVQQNATTLIDGHPEITEIIDGIAQEGVWFTGDAADSWNDRNGYDLITDPDLSREYIDWLDLYRENGVTVFVCEYALDFADDAYDRAYENGFIPYVTRTPLNRLTTTLPPGLD